MRIEDAEVGRAVVYTPYKGCPPDALEEGIITSKNDKYVFVRYGSNYHSKATSPEDLEPVGKGVR